ncbi:MAG: hypothetical protein ACLP51_14160 [Syntrophobacteraceae bacterium]
MTNSTPREVYVRKVGIFRTGKEIEGLRGGVLGYVAQASPKIDAARTEKDPFRMETNHIMYQNHASGRCQPRIALQQPVF